jgi:hypothetical protein
MAIPFLEVAEELLIGIDSPVFAHLPILLSAPASGDIGAMGFGKRSRSA